MFWAVSSCCWWESTVQPVIKFWFFFSCSAIFSKAIFHFSVSFGGYYSRWPRDLAAPSTLDLWINCQTVLLAGFYTFRDVLSPAVLLHSVTSLATAVNRAVLCGTQSSDTAKHMAFQRGLLFWINGRCICGSDLSFPCKHHNRIHWSEGRHKHLAGGSSSC